MKKNNGKKLLIVLFLFLIGTRPLVAYSHIPSKPSFVPQALEFIKSVYHYRNNKVVEIVGSVAFVALLAGVSMYVVNWVQKRSLMNGFKSSRVTNEKTRFDDYVGIPEDVLSICNLIKNPDEAREMNVKVPQGILLYGSPGTGKTFLAKAIAGEMGCEFFQYKGSDFTKAIIGQGGDWLNAAFKRAEAAAKRSSTKTAIIFIDEFDALASKRSSCGANDPSNLAANNNIATLLALMDGFDKDDSYNIVVIAATNRLESIDAAVQRSGRFDYKIEFKYPNLEARTLLIQKLLKCNPCVPTVCAENFAQVTENFSHADIKLVFNNAGIIADPKTKKPRDHMCFLQALLQIKASQEVSSLSEGERRKIILSNQHTHGIKRFKTSHIVNLTKDFSSEDIENVFHKADKAVKKEARGFKLQDIKMASERVRNKIEKENSQKLITTCEQFYGINANDDQELYGKTPDVIIKHFDTFFLQNKVII